MNDPLVLMGHPALPSYTADNLGETVLRLAMFNAQGTNDIAAQDDGCRLVLGLGPTPNLYSADYHSADYRQDKARQSHESPVVFGQSFSLADPGTLRLDSSETVQDSQALPTGKFRPFAVLDESSTSARKSAGGYMPSLLFAPRSIPCVGNEPQLETRDLLEFAENGNDGHHVQPQRQLSPEPSATTECSLGVSSDMVTGATGSEQRGHGRHPKKCRFKGCSKGARGASGLCIAHGGGQRCQKPGCNKGAESRTAYCKAHGGGRRCEQLGCTKSAEGKTDYCIAHGGGRRCGHPGCPKAARGKSGRCIKHGGGKRCMAEGCTRSAEGKAGLCISHGGGRRCQFPDCCKGAQGSTLYCKSHGGGKRCIFDGCTKGAEGSTPLCKGHGGGKRCLFEGGGVCPKSVHGGTNFCVAHGGGKRCTVPGCTKSARGRTNFCVRHGGGKRCKHENCDKSAQGSTDFCKAHGGGKRCTWGMGCEKFARGKSGLCAAHGTLMASQERGAGKSSGNMIGPGLFHGIVSSSATATATATATSSTNNEHSSSGGSTVSECNGSPGSAARRPALIPPQLLVPLSMKSSSSAAPMERGREGGCVVPEGRVHGGGLLSLLGGSFNNVDFEKL